MSSLPQVGVDFAGYRLLAVVARGGMSVVYHAENPRLGNLVALKVLAPELATDDVFRARFLQESRVAASLNHPNVIPIYDAGPCDGLLYIAMRFVTGADLRTVLKAHKRLSPTQALPLLGQAGRALDAAHRQGLVHRDVKPANILIERGTDADDPDHAYLADFGITKHALSRSGLTATGQFVGTIDYIAPEQIQDKPVDGRADIYSLGCVLYECLTGRVPFIKDVDAAVIWAHVEEMPPPPTAIRHELPHAIDAVMARALAKDPADRYATCREFIGAARAALEPHTPPSDDTAAPQAETVLSAPGMPDAAGAGPRHRGFAHPATATSAPESVAESATPASTGAEPPPGDGTAAGGHWQQRRKIAARWGVPAAVGIAILVAAAVAVALLSPGGGRARPRAAAAPPRTNALMQAVRRLNHSAEANGRLPAASCTAHSSSLVTCAHPAVAVAAVTLRTFPSMASLYDAYVQTVKSLSDGHRMRTNFGDCLPVRTHGEVSWNHDYEHPRHYSLNQSRSGKLMDNEAAGRIFCTFHGPQYYIVWTMNDGRMLGMLNGVPHDDAWRWWRAVHHNIAIPGSSGEMGSSSGEMGGMKGASGKGSKSQ